MLLRPDAHGLFQYGDELRPRPAEGIHRTAFDKAFQHLAVQNMVIDAAAEIAERRKGPVFFPARDDGLDDDVADAFDCRKAEAYGAVFDGKHGYTGVDVRCQHLDAVTAAFRNVIADLADIVDKAGHRRRHEFRPVVRLQIRRLPGDVGVGRRVGFIEAVAGEVYHEIKDLVGNVVGNAIFLRPGQKALPLGFQDRFLLLAHGPTQQICLSQREAAHDGSDLHDLFLIQDNAVRVLQNRLQQGMKIGDFLFAVTALNEILYHAAAQRPRTVQGDEGNHVFEMLWRQFLNQRRNARRFHLEHAGRIALRQEFARLLVVQGNGVDIDVDAVLLPYELDGIADDGQRPQAQKVHLEQAQLFNQILVILGRQISFL